MPIATHIIRYVNSSAQARFPPFQISPNRQQASILLSSAAPLAPTEIPRLPVEEKPAGSSCLPEPVCTTRYASHGAAGKMHHGTKVTTAHDTTRSNVVAIPGDGHGIAGRGHASFVR